MLGGPEPSSLPSGVHGAGATAGPGKSQGGRTQLRMKGQNRLPTGFGDALQLGGLWSTPGRGGLEDSLAEAEDGGRHQRPFGRRDVVAGKGGWAGEEVPL